MHAPARIGLKPAFARSENAQQAVNIAVTTAEASLQYLYGNLPISSVIAQEVVRLHKCLQTKMEVDPDFIYKCEQFGLALDFDQDADIGTAAMTLRSLRTTHLSPIKGSDSPPLPNTINHLERVVYSRITGISIFDQVRIENEIRSAWTQRRTLQHYFPVLRKNLHKLGLNINSGIPYNNTW
jgi:hypothetical protein